MALPLFDDFGASIDDIIDVLPSNDCVQDDAPLIDDSMGVTFARICYDTHAFDRLERQVMLTDQDQDYEYDYEQDYDQDEEECNHLWYTKMVCAPNIECHEVQADVYTDEQFELDRLELEEYSRQNPRSDEANARYEKALEALEALSAFDVDKCNRTNREFPVVASSKYSSCASTQTSTYDSECDSDYDDM